MAKENITVGIDVGTTKIAVVIARTEPETSPTIIGVGTSPCEGLRRGVVVNLEKTVEAITSAVNDAELMAGVTIRDAFVGIAGDHIKSLNSRGVIAVSRVDKTITEKDIDRVIDAAKAVRLPDEREIIHVIPQEFIVDNQDGIKNPLDISGVRLEVEVHIVTGSSTAISNVVKCINRANIDVRDIVLQPLASSYAVLDRDEKELGCALVDIGGGTTDIAVFHEEAIRYTSVLGLGGKNVTSDIAIGLRTPIENAELIKVTHGCALRAMASKTETIPVPGPGEREPRQVSLDILGTIIEPRMEELFMMVKQELQNKDITGILGSGIVLTGGASLLRGSAELAEQIFDMPVKIGYPRGFKGGFADIINNPSYSTVLGLVTYGLAGEGGSSGGGDSHSRGGNRAVLKGLTSNLKKWFQDFM
jgi:cell division protein FtsA